ncbi:MAG: leucine--tRNA ligase, partial [Bullifex sp.]|nr:leucine--tRNA ligase [Bullifex sp.]
FAKKFSLPIIEVLKSKVDVQEQAWTEDGEHVNSEWLNGLNKADAIAKMLEFLEKNGCGHKAVNYKLRDWVFSRQRYWGEPIPLVHCPDCGTVLVPEEELPLTLPSVDKYEPSGTGESPLVNVESWVNCKCPKCGGPAKRETNTMPQWAGSCWYYLRYIDPKNEKAFIDPEKEKYWMPVDLYIGGAEHAVLHLLYARFWHKVLYDLGLVSTKEPFQKLVNQGMITSFAYQKPNKSLVPTDMVEERDGKYFDKETGEELTQVIAKMSKSLKNVINPDDFIRDYGADSVRMYEMFMGPLTESKPWATQGFIGVYRFLDRVWRISTEKKIEDVEIPMDLNKTLHKTIRKVTEDTATLNFNTAISQMMVLVNEMNRLEVVPKKVIETLALLLSPYTPHLAEELWSMMGHEPSVANQSWPTYDEELCREDTMEMVVQINGKLRSRIMMPKSASKDEMIAAAKADEKSKVWLDGKTIVKEIAIPGKLVNFVVK